jgi:heterodisulfide reductase subunit A
MSSIEEEQEEQEKQEKQQSVLVLGGGVCGIQVALDLADMGFKVYLVEKKPSIGGHMAQLDKTFPTLDCSACILTPKMVDVARHPNIELLTYSEVLAVSRASKSFEVTILKKSRYVNEDKCTGCGICAQYCPIEVPNEFDQGIGIRKAIYVPFPQAIPLIYTIDKENCIKCGLCERMCEAEAIDHNQQPMKITVTVGSIVVAVGFQLFDAKNKQEYGYGRYDNVITGLDFERLVNAAGPTGGHLARLSDAKIPKKIAFIQCVGSRDEKSGNLNCSRVCCMYAIKQAILAKEHIPDADIHVFYMDIRAYGKGFEEFYTRAKEEFNVKFVRGAVSEIVEIPETKNLIVRVEDTETGELLEKEFDMVVLSVGLTPPSDSEAIENILGISKGEDGFFSSPDPQIFTVDTNIGGIFIAGTAEGPKDIPDSVAQASAAAMKASVALVQLTQEEKHVEK